MPNETGIVFILSTISFVLGLSLTWVNFVTLRELRLEWINSIAFVVFLSVVGIASFFWISASYLFTFLIFVRNDAWCMSLGRLRWIFLSRLVLFSTLLAIVLSGVPVTEVGLLCALGLTAVLSQVLISTRRSSVSPNTGDFNLRTALEFGVYVALSLPLMIVRLGLFHLGQSEMYLLFEDFIRIVEIGVTSATIYISTRFTIKLRDLCVEWSLVAYSFALFITFIATIVVLSELSEVGQLLMEKMRIEDVLSQIPPFHLFIFGSLLLLRVYSQRLFMVSSSKLSTKLYSVLLNSLLLCVFVWWDPTEWKSALIIFFVIENAVCAVIWRNGGFRRLYGRA